MIIKIGSGDFIPIGRDCMRTVRGDIVHPYLGEGTYTKWVMPILGKNKENYLKQALRGLGKISIKYS